MQEGTAAGQLIYIDTHRFEVALGTMDAKKIIVEAVRAGEGDRPGIEAGDYYVVSVQALEGNKTVNVVHQEYSVQRKTRARRFRGANQGFGRVGQGADGRES